MATIEDRLQAYDSYLLLKNFSAATRTSYLRTLREFDRYRRKQNIRGRYGQEQAQRYLVSRIKAGKSWSTINADYSALRKYFREVGGLAWDIKKVPRPRKERILVPNLVRANPHTIRTVFQILYDLLKIKPFVCDKCQSVDQECLPIPPDTQFLKLLLHKQPPRSPPNLQITGWNRP